MKSSFAFLYYVTIKRLIKRQKHQKQEVAQIISIILKLVQNKLFSLLSSVNQPFIIHSVTSISNPIMSQQPFTEPQPVTSQTTDPQAALFYLSNQIQRLNSLLQQKENDLEEAYLRIAYYQSQQRRSRESMALVVMLCAEIEALRYRLNQNLLGGEKEHVEKVNLLKLKKIDWDLKPADFSLIKQIECQHRHLLNFNTLSPTYIQQPTKNPSSPSKPSRPIEAFNPTQTYSHQQESSIIQSSKSLSSSYNSLERSYSYSSRKMRQNHPGSSPKFVQFEEVKQVGERQEEGGEAQYPMYPLYRPLRSQQSKSNMIVAGLGSFGKISQSKNVVSSDSQIVEDIVGNHIDTTEEIREKKETHQQVQRENDQNTSLASSLNVKASYATCKEFSFLAHRSKLPLNSSINLYCREK